MLNREIVFEIHGKNLNVRFERFYLRKLLRDFYI